MIIIRPVPITEPKLISSSVNEDEFPGWIEGIYETGAKVIYQHAIWEALKSTGATPSFMAVEDWLFISATNRYAMFDDSVSTSTIAAASASLVTVIAPGERIDSLAVFRIAGASIRVQVSDTDHDETYFLAAVQTAGWYDYFFSNPIVKEEMIITKIVATSTSQITITIPPRGDDIASCGLLAVGSKKTLAASVYGVTVGIQDFSRKETDDFGRTVLVTRGYIDRLSFDAVIEKEKFASVRRYLANLRTTPCVCAASLDEEATIIYGWYKDFDMVIEGYNHYTISINWLGLL